MKGRILGRLTALGVGAAMGLAVTAWVMPIRLDGEWMLVDRTGYGGGRNPAAGDRIIIENAVFTEHGDGGRLARRVARVDGDRLYVLCEEDQSGLDSRSEAVGLVDPEDVWGRVIYVRKEN